MTVPPHNPDDPWAGFRQDQANIAGDWHRAFGRLRTEEQIRRDLASAAYWPHEQARPFEAPSIASDGRSPATPSTGQDKALTEITDDHDDPGPSHWCAGWALLLLLGLTGAVVIAAAAALITLAAMLGVFG